MEIAAIGLNADEVKTYADHLQEVAKNSDEVSIHLKDNEEVATMVAKSTMRMNRGVEALNEGIMEWDDILRNSDKSSQEYSQALDELRTAMGDLLDVDEKFLSSEFLSNPENLELMK
jgi:methyl-accepting chemotaxis protein